MKIFFAFLLKLIMIKFVIFEDYDEIETVLWQSWLDFGRLELQIILRKKLNIDNSDYIPEN